MEVLFRGLSQYFYKYRLYLVSGILFVIISNFFSIYPAQVVRLTFDLVADLIKLYQITSGFAYAEELKGLTLNAVLLFAGVVTALAILRGIFLFWVRQTLIVVSRKIEYEQKNVLFDHFQRYTLTILRKQKTGDLMARISEDVANVRMFTGPGIMYTLNTITLFLMVLITMLYVNIELTLYVLTPLPVLGFAVYYVNSIILKRSDDQQKQLSTLTSLAQESFAGIRLLKAYAGESRFIQKYSKESDEYKYRALRLTEVDALFFPIILTLVGLSSIFTVWIGGEKVIAGTLTLGNIAEFIIYVNLLVWPIAAMGWVTSLIQKAAASQKRLDEVLGIKPELAFPAESEPISLPNFRFENVSFQYFDAEKTFIKNISFEIPAYKTIGVVGFTGAGKTTLANLLARLIDVSSGTLYVGGKDIRQYSETELRKAIAYVPQDVFLFSDTIRANIAFGKVGATEEEIIAAAQFASVYEDIMHFSEGFDTVIGERGVTLSGGQKQRLSIARAYLCQAPILILDDSLSAVDTRTEEHILQNLQSSLSGSYRPTLIIITHRLSAVAQADNIIVIHEGQVAEQGKHDELLVKDGIYARLHRRQQLEQELAL